MKTKTKLWWKSAGIRAIKTVAQTLGAQLPVGFVVTPVMISEANWSYLTIFVAWLCTGLFAGFASLLTSLAGLPEVDAYEAEDGQDV